MESLHQSHSRKDLLTQLSALMGFISSEENPMIRFSYSLGSPQPKIDCGGEESLNQLIESGLCWVRWVVVVWTWEKSVVWLEQHAF